ncbi:hypothetical protein EO087_03030 [Dyella sp. M7H15-1]|uniref:hypothetical protein n=1 Tax=Dyella sp. M7H15-1 TaxID=2501295 RepID=UPI0010051FD7|nr:hypothetical protein [Dyella sp. M7H15-1]QAU23087.1 hypothetical protein EO087_03030 [Dyella sp. M7H15-1]
MKHHTPLLVSLISASMLFTSAVLAQQSMQSPSGSNNSVTFNSAQGQVTIHSKLGPTPSTASPPSFEQLSGGSKVISESAANAYPPLANDFKYAADGGNSITKAQYERWVSKLN